MKLPIPALSSITGRMSKRELSGVDFKNQEGFIKGIKFLSKKPSWFDKGEMHSDKSVIKKMTMMKNNNDENL